MQARRSPSELAGTDRGAIAVICVLAAAFLLAYGFRTSLSGFLVVLVPWITLIFGALIFGVWGVALARGETRVKSDTETMVGGVFGPVAFGLEGVALWLMFFAGGAFIVSSAQAPLPGVPSPEGFFIEVGSGAAWMAAAGAVLLQTARKAVTVRLQVPVKASDPSGVGGTPASPPAAAPPTAIRSPPGGPT
jgi:hypothetical protein